MQKRKIRIFLKITFLVVFIIITELEGCGTSVKKKTNSEWTESERVIKPESNQTTEQKKEYQECLTSENCREGEICVDGECLIPKLEQ
jgi:uncharacterized protein YceK